jgi:parallel beta-helix repeat protein
MRTSVLLWTLVLACLLSFPISCGCGDDDDDDSGGASSDDDDDVCADFCEIIAHCDMGEGLNVYTMEECLDFCLQVGSVGNCVMAATDCEEATACFEEESICGEGEIWDEQLGECLPEKCGLDQYPTAPFEDKALIYVDAAYTGDSDGSAERPYKTIEAALANAGENTSILIAVGDYVELATLIIDKDGLDLVGRCSYLTKTRSAEGGIVLRVDDANSNLISGIAYYAEGESDWALPMIKLSGTSDTEFLNNSVTDSTGKGLSASSCDAILISNNVFRGNTEYCIYFSNSNEVNISGNDIRDTKPNEQDDFGRGINIQYSEQISVSDNIVEGNADASIFFAYTTGTISGNEVRDTRLNGQGKAGRGISVQDSGQVSISANIVEGNAEAGIYFSGASGTISGNEVCNNFKRGIVVGDSEQISVSDNIMENNTEMGITFRNASGTISGNEVRDTRPDGQGMFGRGISVEYSEQISVSDNIVEGNTEMGIGCYNVTGAILRNEVRDTRPDGQGKFGRGIEVQDSEQVSVSDNIVEGNTYDGIFFAYSSGTISGNEVRDTKPDGQGEFGRGISAQDSEQISVSDNIVEGNHDMGICFHNVTGAILRNEVRDTLPGAPNDEGYTFGHGIHVQVSTDVECSSNIVENNLHAGISYIFNEGGNIYDNYVSGTMSESRDISDRGDGIIVLGAEGFISIQDNTLDSNDRCGILADSSIGMIERNGIFGNEYSIVSQNGSDMAVSDNDIHDNDIDIVQFFEGRELSVNDSMIERNG